MKKKQRIRFIVNPFSGTGKKRGLSFFLNKFLDKDKFDFEICQTKAPGHAKELSREAVNADFDIIVAVGGDGSVNEVSNPLIGTEKILGIIPAGSGNGFASHLGISRQKISAIQYLNTAKAEKIDTCQLNGQHFLNVAGVGFSAMVAYKIRRSKFRGFFGYLITALVELIRYRIREYTITINGKEFKRDCFAIEIANGSTFGYNMKIASNASLTDGLMEVVIIRKAPKWRYLFSLWRFFTGTIHKSALVETYSAKNVEIKPEHDCTVHVDGEGFLSNETLKFWVNPLSLNVLKSF